MKNIIFIAPPSAGKGTQSEMLEEKFGYKHISTGDLLRAEIATGSELGLEIKALVDEGIFVSDELIARLLVKELESQSESLILDGFPRNLKQAEMLEGIFKQTNITDYVVIYLSIAKDEARGRALGRLICDTCGATYSEHFMEMRPKNVGVCDKCGGTLAKRADDTVETFNKRFDTYMEQTGPLVEYYIGLNKLVTIPATNKNEVFDKITEVIKG